MYHFPVNTYLFNFQYDLHIVYKQTEGNAGNTWLVFPPMTGYGKWSPRPLEKYSSKNFTASGREDFGAKIIVLMCYETIKPSPSEIGL